MTAPFFTNNDADVTQLEGVYIKETTPPATVGETSLNTVGIFGKTLKGPVGTAVNITSESRFNAVFGGGFLNGVRVNDVWVSLLNKGFSNLWITRVAAAAAVKSSFTLESASGGGGTAVLRIDASSPGTWGNYVKWRVGAATDSVATHFDLFILDTLTGNVTQYKNIDIVGGDNTLTLVGTDDARLVDLAKLAATRPSNSVASTDGADADGYTFLGQTVAAYTSVAGTDGSIADSDYLTGLATLATHKDVAVVFAAEYTSSTLKAQIKIDAAASSDRIFLAGATDGTTTVSAAVSDVASYRSDRIIYCYNHPYTIDPVTAAEIQVRPESWMATVLANTDVDIHPGEQDTKRFLAGITKLTQPGLTRADYIQLRAAGISALEVDLGDPVFVSGVVTDLTPGKTEITRRRMADFLQLSAAFFLRFHVKKKNTPQRRTAIKATLQGWLSGLQRQGRVVAPNENGLQGFNVDTEILNTPTDTAAGIAKTLMQVRFLPHMLFMELVTDLGTGVVISSN